MQSKKCPTCSSHRIAGPQRIWSTAVDTGTMTGASVFSYVCVDCGHIELFTDEKGREKLRKNGEVTLNAPNPEITECPSCGTPFRRSTFLCKKCGTERDFSYLKHIDLSELE